MRVLINTVVTAVVLALTVDAARKGAPKAASFLGKHIAKLKDKVVGYIERVKKEYAAMKKDAQKLRELADNITQHVAEELGGGFEKGSPSYIKLRRVIIGEIAREAIKRELGKDDDEETKELA